MLCQNLKNRCQRIKTLRDRLVSVCEEAKTLDHQKLAELWKAKTELEKEREELLNLIIPKKIETNWKNPENQKEKKITINFEEEIQFFQEFYQKHLQIELNTKEIRSILRKHKKEIQKEMEQYGYDQILIIPENLPEEKELNEKLIETMEEEVEENGEKKMKKVEETKYWADQNTLTSAEKPKYRIILVHSDQNIYQNEDANPYLKATLGKNIPQLIFGISDEKWEEIESGGREEKYKQDAMKELEKGEILDIHLEIQSQKILIQAEGLSLREYEIFQRIFFEKHKKHLDVEGWTWLPKSFSGSRVVAVFWYPFVRQFGVHALDPSDRDDDLCLRLSRSFSN